MTLRLNMNLAAFTAHRFLNANGDAGRKSREKLSSGLRINRAADDAAGLGVSEKMRAQIRGLSVAQRNALDGISLVDTADGALVEVHAMLQRARELAVQAANGTLSDEDRGNLALELGQLANQMEEIQLQTRFNGQKVFDPDNPTLTLQVGAYESDTLEVEFGAYGDHDHGTGDTAWNWHFNFGSASSSGSQSHHGVNSTMTQAQAMNLISGLDDSIDEVSAFRARLGAARNNLSHVFANLAVTQENVSASESRIRDTDMAKELSLLTRSQILSQAATAMLAQANQAPQTVLSLIR